MSKMYPSEVAARMERRLTRLYGADATKLLMERLAAMMGRYGVGLLQQTPRRWDQHDVALITYADAIQTPGEKTLKTLRRFADEKLKGSINIIHLLPFFPYSSDDGFSVVDYREVRPELGDWEDVQAIGQSFNLMMDLVLNHVSRQSAWFKDYIDGDAPYRDYFIEVDSAADLSAVVRPRSSPLLTQVYTPKGIRHVWTTFSEDQIDVNFANPDVLFEFLDIVFWYISMGARILRLDAIAYLWKKIGTPSIHLPETHEVVKLFRNVFSVVAPNVLILTETNVPHVENISYFGNGDEAHMVYQFSLPPLLLHALQTGDGSHLTRWAQLLPPLPAGCTFLNFTASHDGIGVRPLQGLIPQQEVQNMLARIQERGGKVSMKRNADGSESPYELNITYFDALADPAAANPKMDRARFLCSQTIALALRGIPAIYFSSLMGAHNDLDGVQQTGRARTINRKKWNAETLNKLLDDTSSAEAQLFNEYLRRLKLRRQQLAFHPDSKQHIFDWGSGSFVLERRASGEDQIILAVHNLMDRELVVQPSADSPFAQIPVWKDVLTDKHYESKQGSLSLDAYQALWLKPATSM